MIHISTEDWNNLPKDYKSVWTSDNIHGTKNDGKRTWMTGNNGSSVLLIEGTGFLIVEPDEDGVIQVECDECEGSGEIAHDDDSFNSPAEIYTRCETCCGEGTFGTEYDGY